jgi:hypothetical protein
MTEMVRIIKPGITPDRSHRFICVKCECVFETDDFTTDGKELKIVSCPWCGWVIWLGD